ncbi:MAG: MBL fold metallo-hydrolase [Alphaproteobacteria bacterium]|nr:MBL fold metallo-hydrolase [Alphaproteobacteria bacterium]
MSDTDEGGLFRLGEFEVDIIVHGFPGKSVCHGSLGFSAITLIRRGDRIALLDVGSFGQRFLLQEQLAARGLTPGDVTDVLLTHSHYDHSVNWTLFKHANIVIGRDELAWSLEQPWGETVVPELYVEALDKWPTLRRVDDGDEVFPGITAHMAPGHTPGSLVFVLDGGERDIVFSGDACKNRAELLSRAADMTYDDDATRASIDDIWALWSRRPGSILAPGHDLPMVLENGEPRYLGKREAAIRAWYGEDLNQTTVISLLPGAV